MEYDIKNTFYLKCLCCNNILIDVEIKDEHLDPMVVFNCDVEYGKEYRLM